MTSAAKSNYGTVLKKDDSTTGTLVGEVVSIDPPEYMQAAVEATNHSSGGYRQFVSSMLSEMGEFKATINYLDSDIDKLVTDLKAGTVAGYTITYPTGHKQKFSALPTSIKPTTADAANPGTLQAEITFRPTDSTSFSS